MAGTELSIVIPIYNEEPNLAALIAEIDDCLPQLPASLEVIAVDDGSRDGSWDALCRLASGRPWLRALRFMTNRGQTAAMAAGIGVARGRWIAFLDADLQNDVHDLPRLIAPIAAGEADVVCGWRANRRDRPAKTIPSRVANLLIRQSLHFTVHDVGCTLKVFRREFIEDVVLFGEMHRFLPSYAHAQGARVVEIVVAHRPRHAGASKYGLERVGKVIIDLLTVKMLNDYGASPAYLFGKIALLFALLGSAAFALVAWRVIVLHRYEATPMVFIMTLLYIAALLALMSGLLAEINMRVLHQVGGQKSYKVVDRIGFDEVS